jgi:hypothetical protein
VQVQEVACSSLIVLISEYFPAIGLVSVGMINTQQDVTCEFIKKPK